MSDKEFRASEAERLLHEPLLMEAFDKIEREAVEGMVEAPRTPEGDVARRALADKVAVLRALKEELKLVIADGKQAIRGAPPVA